jgi:hypothetical protein
MRGNPVVIAAVAGVCLWGCKTISEELPTTPTGSGGQPVVNVPFPVTVTPVTIPQPAPAPEATPTPSAPGPNNPPPNPEPPPDDENAPQSCKPAHETGNQRCPREGSSDFINVVFAAYDSLNRNRPDLVKNDQIRVSEDDWAWAVVQEIRRRGYCAGMYAEEVSVRTSNAFSENFDVVTASGTVRRGEGAYRSTCYPASTTRE